MHSKTAAKTALNMALHQLDAGDLLASARYALGALNDAGHVAGTWGWHPDLVTTLDESDWNRALFQAWDASELYPSLLDRVAEQLFARPEGSVRDARMEVLRDRLNELLRNTTNPTFEHAQRYVRTMGDLSDKQWTETEVLTQLQECLDVARHECEECEGTGREQTHANRDERGAFIAEDWCPCCNGFGVTLKFYVR